MDTQFDYFDNLMLESDPIMNHTVPDTNIEFCVITNAYTYNIDFSLACNKHTNNALDVMCDISRLSDPAKLNDSDPMSIDNTLDTVDLDSMYIDNTPYVMSLFEFNDMPQTVNDMPTVINNTQQNVLPPPVYINQCVLPPPIYINQHVLPLPTYNDQYTLPINHATHTSHATHTIHTNHIIDSKQSRTANAKSCGHKKYDKKCEICVIERKKANMCIHGSNKYECAKCKKLGIGGGSICDEHGKRRTICKKCRIAGTGGFSLCIHTNRKGNCAMCKEYGIQEIVHKRSHRKFIRYPKSNSILNYCDIM